MLSVVWTHEPCLEFIHYPLLAQGKMSKAGAGVGCVVCGQRRKLRDIPEKSHAILPHLSCSLLKASVTGSF